MKKFFDYHGEVVLDIIIIILQIFILTLLIVR